MQRFRKNLQNPFGEILRLLKNGEEYIEIHHFRCSCQHVIVSLVSRVYILEMAFFRFISSLTFENFQGFKDGLEASWTENGAIVAKTISSLPMKLDSNSDHALVWDVLIETGMMS